MGLYGGGALNTNDNLTLSDFTYGRGDVLGTTVNQVLDESPFFSVLQASAFALAKDQGEKLSSQQALKSVGELGLSIDIPEEGISQPALDILISRERDRIKRDHVFANRNDNPGVWSALQQLGVGLAVSVVDPLNIATAVVPQYGIARFAKTSASFKASVQAAPIRTAVADAVVGGVAAEAITLPSQQYLQSDYGMYDSVLNLGMGVAFAGLVQAGTKGITGYRDAVLKRRDDFMAKQSENLAKAVQEKRDMRDRGEIGPVEVREVEMTPEEEFGIKFQYAEPETRNSVFQAILMRAVDGKDIDVNAIINADINALAGRQVFELDQLKEVFDGHFDDIVDVLARLKDKSFLGKRKSERNVKQIKELEDALNELYFNDAWTDYQRKARRTLKDPEAKRSIRNLAERYQQADVQQVLDRISALRDRIESGRASASVKEALDRLQQRAEEYEAMKQMVVRNADRLQTAIDSHPETLRRLEQHRQDMLDPEKTVWNNTADARAVEEQMSQPDITANDVSKQIDDFDSESEILSEIAAERYPDEDFTDLNKEVSDIDAEAQRTADEFKNLVACVRI